MIEKRINGTMAIMSLIGGIIGFVIGEVLLNNYQYIIPNSILMGLYFGILAFSIGTMCLIAEIINPKLNGFGWKNNYLKTSFKFLIPCTLVALFVFGAFFQFLYDMTIGNGKKINDVVLVIDTSGSMRNTDPKNERFEAAKNLLDNMNEDNRASVYEFNDKAEKVQAMSKVTEAMRKETSEKLKKYELPNGNTNMGEALQQAYSEIKSTSSTDRNAMIILLSDGGDTYDLDRKFNDTMKPLRDNGIPVYTIGMSNGNNFSMLKRISKQTRGNYYNVKDVKDLKSVFNKIYKDSQNNLLVDKRSGVYEGNNLYAVLRILFITLLACLISVGVSLVFDNKNLLKGFIVGGIVSGIIAALVLEIGFLYIPWIGMAHRAIADIIIALIFTLIPVKVDVKEYSKKSYMYENKKTYIDSNKKSKDMFN